MTDLDVAILLLKVANDVDNGCPTCRSEALKSAMSLAPHLPWRMAAEGLHSNAVANNSWDDFEWVLNHLNESTRVHSDGVTV